MPKAAGSLKKALLEKTQEVELLHRITRIIGSTLTLKEILAEITALVSQVTKADACFLYLHDRASHELVLSASKTPHPKEIGKIRLKLGEGITGWVAKEKKTVVIHKNASEDSRFKFFQNLPEDSYQGFVSVPVIAKGNVIGVINVHHKKPTKQDQHNLELLETIASQVGGAIEHARLYEEAKRKAHVIETLSQVSKTITSNRYLEEILSLIVTMTAQLMNSKICSIMLLDEGKKELVIKATQALSEKYRVKPPIKIGQSISGRAVTERKALSVLDVKKEKDFMYPDLAQEENLCSLLCVPMMLKDRVVGVINSYTTAEHRFTEDEISLMNAVAHQAAVAIENTKLFGEMSQMQEALETRKVIERAKGILMDTRRLTEQIAFKEIQKQSMDMRKSMKEIAEAIILSNELSKRAPQAGPLA